MFKSEEIKKNAHILWDYLCLRQPLEKVDVIFVMGSYDIRSGEHGAQLWLDGWAPIVVFSGGLGNFTAGHFQQSEADRFADRAREMGVPEDSMIIENQSTNSGENIQFSLKLLREKGIEPKKWILVQKPNMLRRAYATFMQQHPGCQVMCSGANITLEQVPHGHMTIDKVISEMCGDFQRIVEYPKLGFQIPQEVPSSVMQAFEALVKAGYDEHLLRS